MTGQPRPWFRVEANAATAQPTADVYIYDEIGDSWWGGVSPKALVDEITALDVQTMTVHVNSPGGAAWDGITIMNALRRHPARVEVIVDGLAASAASVIVLAGDKVTMNRGAQLMIHDASGGAWGNASDLESAAGILHKLSDSYADIYAARAGGDRAQWREAMRVETWYTAEEAVQVGLADAWDGTTAEAPAASFDLKRFRYPGRAYAPAPLLAAAINLPSSTEPDAPNREEIVVDHDAFVAGIRDRLGMTDATVDDETVLAALDEALTEQAETETPQAALPEGVVTIDATVLAQLQANASRGAAAAAEQDRVRRDAIVADALRAGRITAESRDVWRGRLDKDETEFAGVLAGLPANTALPVVEMGHAVGEPQDDAYPASWKH